MECEIEYLRCESRRLLFVMFFMLYHCFSGVAFGQDVPGKQDDLIKLGTTLVQVPVVVSDFGGRYITDLGERDFAVYEDGIKQQISYFGSIEEPFTVALLLDSSGSTQSQLNVIKQAAQAFIDNLRPQDQGLIIVFNDSVEVVCELTGNKSLMSKAIEKIRPGEFTQVYEAVYTAVWERLKDIDGRKAIVLFTDGIDTASSEINDEDTFDAVVESEDVIIYPVRFSTRGDVEAKLRNRSVSNLSGVGGNGGGNLTNHILELDRAYRRADEYLYELANLSGGVVERADKITDLKSAFGRIAEELRHQYVVGYYPANREKTNLMHKIDVKVNRPDVKVRFRPGYKNSDQ